LAGDVIGAAAAPTRAAVATAAIAGKSFPFVPCIYEVRGSPPDLRWFWSLHLNGPMKRSDRVASLEEAKAQLKASWKEWKTWAQG
jgi:hypothetical protein